MSPGHIALRICLLAAGTLPFGALAATYSWIDHQGAVNYGDAPPAAARQVRLLDEAAGRVSTIPAVPQAQRERESDFLLRARIARLEAEIEAQRRAQVAAPVPVPVLVPVYDPFVVQPTVLGGFTPVFGPPHHWRRARWQHRPVHPPVRSGVSIRVGSRR
jgi:Domain of unknown function (DUF4124)